MNEKTLDRISSLESLSVIFNIPDDALNKSQSDIMNGALLYPAIQLKYTDNSKAIYETITKNFFLMEKEVSIMQKSVERYNDLVYTIESLNDFVDNYANQTGVMLSSIIDWANSYSGNYIYYDSMIYSSMTSSFYGWFNSNAGYYSFGSESSYNDKFSSSNMLLEVLDGTRVVTRNEQGSNFIKVVHSTSASKIVIRATFSTPLLNYGMSIRSNKSYEYNLGNYTSHDSFPLNLNYIEEFIFNGESDGNLYYYDINFICQPFFMDGGKYEYVTKDIDVSSINKLVKIEVDFSSNYISSFLTKRVGETSFEQVKQLNSGVNPLVELIDSTIKYDHVDGNKTIGNVITIGNEYGYNFKDFITSNNLHNYVFGDILYGVNCIKKSPGIVDVVNSIEVDGQYTYKIDEIFKDKDNDIIDIPITVRDNISILKTNVILNGVEREANTFSVFGKADKIYISENSVYYSWTGQNSELDDLLSGKKKYFMTYVPSTNITTFITLSSDLPTDIVYTTSLYNLLNINGFTISNADISTDFVHYNYNVFGSKPENSMFLITPTGFIKNEQFTDASNVYELIKSQEIDRIQISMVISLEKVYRHNVYSCKVYAKEDVNIKLNTNSGTDNLVGRNYTINNANISVTEVNKEQTANIEIIGDVEYAKRITASLIGVSEITMYSGIKLSYSKEEVSGNKYRLEKIGNLNYVISVYNLSSDVSVNGTIIPMNNVSYAPLSILYRERASSPDIRYILRLSTPYNGYVLDSIKIFGD